MLFLLVELSNVERLVNVPRNRANFSSKLLLNPVKSKSIIISDKVDGNTEVSKPSTSANPVEIGLCHLWKIKVDDHIHSLDVYTTSEQIAADQVSTESSPEIMEHPVPVSLSHFGVNIIAGVTKLGYLLGEELYSLCRVAKNYALINLELGKERV